jgi:hypothetical protein
MPASTLTRFSQLTKERHMRIWHQQQANKRAYIERVNHKYRLTVYELWLDRYGKLNHEGLQLACKSYMTLAQAKQAGLKQVSA